MDSNFRFPNEFAPVCVLSGRPPNVAILFRSDDNPRCVWAEASGGTESFWTLRWRETDSNFRYRGTKAADFRSAPTGSRIGRPALYIKEPCAIDAGIIFRLNLEPAPR